MNKIIEYTIVTAPINTFNPSIITFKELNDKVNELIGQGWQPFGVISLSESRAVQTLVLYEDETVES